ncbi:MAG TPA: universal stress protein [Desulfoprunum sp.]|nr:universal stress protein [Desulfoprunum sp.]
MKRFKNILYVNEPSVDRQETAIARAVSLAERNRARLTVVDVIPVITPGYGLPPGGPITSELQISVAGEHLRRLEKFVAPFTESLDIQCKVLVGKTFLEVIRTILTNAYDLVIKPAENLVLLESLFGSNDMHLLRKCPCPVWLLNRNEKPEYSNILAAVDFDPFNPLGSQLDLNLEILQLSSDLALSDHAILHIVHAWDAFAESTMLSRGSTTEKSVFDYVGIEQKRHANGLMMLNEELSKLIGDAAYKKLSSRHHLPKGPADKAIVRLAKEMRVDVVVMGTIARTGIAGFIIGNTAETILDQLTCSVLAVKPPGFVSPVRVGE